MDMYRMNTALSLILLVSEMLEIPGAKVEVNFLNKLAFVTNKCLGSDAFGNCPKTTENLSKYAAFLEWLLYSNFLIFLYILESYPSK